MNSEKLMHYYNDIRKANSFKSVWSLCFGQIGRKLEWQDMEDESGIPEGTTIRYWSIWGDRGQKSFAKIKGKTWLDVWAACDQAIRHSGDRDHIFIEALSWVTIEQEDGSAETFLELTTGS